ncbi:MAG TPA: hypothetical protein VG722_09295 [Tepidisphaeraceae bacterium]|nr:hypothetical protein [Tepidisphaeraceae bacterium]
MSGRACFEGHAVFSSRRAKTVCQVRAGTSRYPHIIPGAKALNFLAVVLIVVGTIRAVVAVVLLFMGGHEQSAPLLLAGLSEILGAVIDIAIAMVMRMLAEVGLAVLDIATSVVRY